MSLSVDDKRTELFAHARGGYYINKHVHEEAPGRTDSPFRNTCTCPMELTNPTLGIFKPRSELDRDVDKPTLARHHASSSRLTAHTTEGLDKPMKLEGRITYIP